MTEAYTREELSRVDPGAWPERGQRCDQCKTVIPEFAELTASESARIKQLSLNGQPVLAMQELAALVGCPLRWAKIWVVHLGKAKPKHPGPPCPRCGKPLRTSRARQCPHCNADWHESTERDRATHDAEKLCDECGSMFLRAASPMSALCPECAHHLYGYEPCPHEMLDGRCRRCHWDGSVSEYLEDRKANLKDEP